MQRWSGILEFIAVADTGSFTRAARQLNTSVPQVSKALSRLEQRLEIQLLHRTTRMLALTEAGVRYRQRCLQMLRDLEAAEQEIADEQELAIGTLRINISGAFQERFLVPVIAQFLADHPRVRIDLHFSDRYVDPLEAGFDVSICHSPLPDSSRVARYMATITNLMVASPAYLAARGMPTSVDDLKHHNCIVGADNVWLLSDGETRREVRVQGSWHSDNANAILSAARCGVGIAQLHGFGVEQEIALGNLVEILPAWNRMPVEVWCMTPNNKLLPAKTRRFVDFLRTMMVER